MIFLINKRGWLSYILNAMISPESVEVCHQLFSFPLLSAMHLLYCQLADVQISPAAPRSEFIFHPINHQ